jgi:asparagine synthase (glutamine-hydrolysing)
MCGITGFVDFEEGSDEQLLKNMTSCLTHRGPDDEGFTLAKFEGFQVGLGHRRLSIIDLSPGGKQPMRTGELEITFNGEIFNYVEIRDELIKNGHSFKSNSDTEVILRAYKQWGGECVKRFIGMFAFVILDHERRELFITRDRAGIKPLFYHWDGSLFLFGSELKTFHKHPRFKKELNIHAVASFVQFGNVPTPHSIFRNTYKLKPGHSMIFSMSDKKIKTVQYWDVYDNYNKPKLNISFEEARDETEKIMKKAFEYRMVSDVPVGIFLSGGYDSTCLTALLQKGRSEKLKTFTIAVPDIGLNEAPYAKKTAEYFGTDHHEYLCSENEVLELITELPYFYDEPFADSSAIPTTLVSKMARKQVTVALSADGGDEIFAGYNRYDYLIKYGRVLNSLPGVLRKGGYTLMKALPADSVPGFSRTYNFHNRYEKLKLLLKDPSPKNMMLSLSKQYDESHTMELFAKPVFPQNTAYQSDELLDQFYSPLSYMLAIDWQTYLLDDILQKVDRASMSAGLEAREPYLDQHIIEWAAKLPDNYKYHQGVKKYILREIVHKHIPKEMMDRPKMGFAIPIETWLAADLRDKVEYYLSPARLNSQGIFREQVVTRMKKDFFSGKKELGLKIWYLLMFQMWHERWME